MRFVILASLFLLVACRHNPPEYNTIVFEDSLSAVEDTLRNVVATMTRLGAHNGVNYWWSPGSGLIALNDTEIRDTTVLYADTLSLLKGLSRSERQRLLAEFLFLQRNHMQTCSRERGLLAWDFSYRPGKLVDGNDYRWIVPDVTPQMEQELRALYMVLGYEGDNDPVGAKGSQD